MDMPTQAMVVDGGAPLRQEGPMSSAQPAETASPRAAPARRHRPWTAAAVITALIVVVPAVAVSLSVLRPSEGVWAHLATTVLAEYVSNSLALVLGVVALATLIGVTTGWLVAATEFPGRRIFEWALMLPMTVPSYVIAYVYFDLLTFAGPVQTWLREAFGWQRGDYWFFPIASLQGATVLMALVFYPYVYLLSRAVFLRQSVHLMEAARALGHGPVEAFFRVALPMARPAIVAGAAFVAMEVLADYGTVLHLGVPTLTTGIFRTWFSRGAPVAAAQLATMLLVFVGLALALERIARGGQRFDGDSGGRSALIGRRHLGALPAALAVIACLLPVVLGFAVPAVELVRLSILVGDPFWGPRFIGFAMNSLTLASLTAALLVAIGLVLAYARRLDGGPLVGAALQVASLGYAIPGAVIAVGVLIPLAAFDNAVDGFMRAHFGMSTGLMLTGTMAALLYAYVVRFLAVSLSTIDAGLTRLPPSLENAARSLGAGPARALLTVHLPLLRGSLISAAIFVFADVMKELPATLIVRPFNLDTLAVRTFRLAADGRLDEASTSALVIVAVGIVPVILLSRAMNEPGPGADRRP
jgi:iron(III) transport system permease protein